jgi:hypothetical protein
MLQLGDLSQSLIPIVSSCKPSVNGVGSNVRLTLPVKEEEMILLLRLVLYVDRRSYAVAIAKDKSKRGVARSAL